MISSRRLSLIALNLLLGSGVYLIWTQDEELRSADIAGTLTRHPAQQQAAVEDLPNAADQKPLFRVRPPATVAVVGPSLVPQQSAPNFRLAGVIWAESDKVAVVEMAEDGKHRRLRIGESVGDWTLRELSARTATVESGENTVEMRLTTGVAQ